MLDDAYFNGYAKLLGMTTSMVYVSLCRFVDKSQTCFPSQKLIAEKLGLNPRTVMDKVKILTDWNIIRKQKVKSKKGKWCNNVYVLLDKGEWNKPPAEKLHMETTCRNPAKPPAVSQHIKGIYIEGNNNRVVVEKNKLIKKVSSWAYERASTTPSCSREAFEKSVAAAIDRSGEAAVKKCYEVETNAISFLRNIKLV